MLQKLLFLILLPVLVWMLIGSYRELKRDFRIESDRDLLFRMIWLFGLAYAVITSGLMVLLDSYLVLTLKRW